MSAPEPEYDELLRRVLAGEADVEGDEVTERARRDPAFREELAEVRAVLGRLDGAGAFERSVIAEAATVELPAAETRVVDAVLSGAPAAAPARGTAPAPRRWRRWILAAAAAALLLALPFLWREDGGGLRPGRPLGARVELVEPVGAASDLGRFRWSFDLPASGWYVVVVHDATTPGIEREVARSGELEEPHWTPESTATWPDRIRWEVRPFDASGSPAGSPGSAVAWR